VSVLTHGPVLSVRGGGKGDTVSGLPYWAVGRFGLWADWFPGPFYLFSVIFSFSIFLIYS
jgi:hypothetical protein